MEDDTKKKLTDFATSLLDKAKKKARVSTGWQKLLWISACVACAIAGYFLSSCTASYTQSTEGGIEFNATIVQPAEFRK